MFGVSSPVVTLLIACWAQLREFPTESVAIADALETFATVEVG
jgi:hypothetical protein